MGMTHNSKLALEIMEKNLEGKDVIVMDPKGEGRITTEYVNEVHTLRRLEEYDVMVYSIVSDALITKDELLEEMIQMQISEKQAPIVVFGESGERFNAISFALISAERAVKLEKVRA